MNEQDKTKCPKCGTGMNLTHLMYIEECSQCNIFWDVAHNKEVEYEWVYGDDDSSEGDIDGYPNIFNTCPNCGAEFGIEEMEWDHCHACGWREGELMDSDDDDDFDYEGPDSYPEEYELNDDGTTGWKE